MTRYYSERRISPHHSGFGMWSVEQMGERYVDEDVLHAEMRDGVGELYELGVDELPEGCEDIRGHIYNQPPRIFVYSDPVLLSPCIGKGY